jgi:glycerol-3-phosphate dehydrogenase
VPPEPSEELVRHFCDQEWAQHLDDVMVRRTSWSYYRGDHAELAGQAAAWMGAALGWDAARIEREVQDYRRQHATLVAG